MTKRDWWTNMILALMAAALLAICVRSIVGETKQTHRQQTEYGRDT